MSNLPTRILALTFLLGGALGAQTPLPQANRITAAPNLAEQVQLTGHIPGWATADRQTAKAVDLGATMHVSIVIARDPAVQTAFEKLLADQQTPGSPMFHQWLTPQQIGDLFGPTNADLAALTSWLTAQGLAVETPPSRAMLNITGTTAQVAAAFHTSFAYFQLKDEARLSAISEPSIPAALSLLVRSIYGLADIPIEPASHSALGHLPSTTGPRPAYTYAGSSATYHYVTPNDFAVIYDIKSLYNGGNTGATIGSKMQHVAIIGRSRVAPTDISEYEAKTGLPSTAAIVIIPPGGIDPGTTQTGDQGEATLDVDRVIGTAPGVVPDLIIATNGSGGVGLAVSYNVNTLLDPVMTLSFGACENNAGQSGVNYYDSLFSQAAGEGISVFVASGDSGVAGCEPYNATPTIFPQVASTNYICASTYATCLGGTEFNDTASPTTYWASSNSTGLQSALSYIPEGAWNEPSTVSSGTTTFYDESTGGGASKYIAKPTWQTGVGVPTDGARDTPDISFTSAGHDGYYTCLDYQFPPNTCLTGAFVYFYGTSAAAPGMAGVAALLNTAAGKAQGNLNPLIYKLASSSSVSFHDATVASSGVGSCSTATPSICNNSVPSATALTGGLAGFALTTGYDEATGLGSLDVTNFVAAYLAAANDGFSLTPASTAISFVSGATSGNTNTVTVSSKATFSGAINLTCSIAPLPVANQPTCAVASSTVTLAAASSTPVVVTISSTTAHSLAEPLRFHGFTGVVLSMLICLLPRRHLIFSRLAVIFAVAFALSSVSGCSSSSVNTAASPTLSSSAGSYIVTVTGTNSATSTTVNATFSLTIQ